MVARCDEENRAKRDDEAAETHASHAWMTPAPPPACSRDGGIKTGVTHGDRTRGLRVIEVDLLALEAADQLSHSDAY